MEPPPEGYDAFVNRPNDDETGSPFVINVEEVAAWSGSTFKAVKMIVLKFFKPNVDFKMSKIKDERGRPKEKLMISVDTFKGVCMLSKTKKGAAVRRYFIEVERLHKDNVCTNSNA